jgi:hypothetical protein
MKKVRYFARIIMYISFFCAGLGLLIDLSARQSAAYSKQRFSSLLRKNDLSVVLFYHQDFKSKKNKLEKKNTTELLKDFKAASRIREFSRASVRFISVNTAKSKIKDLADKYGIAKKKIIVKDQSIMIARPTIMLFKNGKNFNNIRITGDLSKARIKAFVDQYFSNDIRKVIKEKDEERKRKLEEARYRHYYTPYYYNYGWSWPYHHGYWPYYSYGHRWGRGYWGHRW